MNLSRRLFAPALGVGAASIGRAFAQADSAAAIRIPTGQVAGHAIARAIVATDGTIEVIAYYPLFIVLATSYGPPRSALRKPPASLCAQDGFSSSP